MNNPTPSLLLVEDDETFAQVAARALERRGFAVRQAASTEAAHEALEAQAPLYAVLDLRLGEDSGLSLLPDIFRASPDCRVVVLTGYASIATAVQAIKLGATNYLTKPVEINSLVAALREEDDDDTTAEAVPPSEPMSVRRLGWEHVQRVLDEADGNVSEAARRLGMHRRSLQRMLGKRPPKR